LVCEAAGFDLILVETVGVGQSETTVADMTDMFVLLLQPGGGDQLQGIKRGIMELADLVLVNKADGDSEAMARESAMEFRNALHLMRPRTPDWTVAVLTCSALHGEGLDDAWKAIQSYQQMIKSNGMLASRRSEQARTWMWAEVRDSLMADLAADADVQKHVDTLEVAVGSGELPATLAAAKLLDIYLKRN
ncbi:MAG: methylmalonyl Co-A mutase-associated GTPase MeaB, partial [Pseudomonadota bacterium]